MKKKLIAVALSAVLAVASLTGCGKTAVPSATNSSYDDVVAYLTSEGYIAKDASPVDITANGADYFTDNTDGEWTEWACADQAEDYDGLYLFYWNGEDSEYYVEVYQSIAVNGNMILLGGGAAMLQAAGVNGNYAIAFSEDYADQDGALAAFNAMTE